MTTPNTGSAESVTVARSVSPATSVTPANPSATPATPATDLPYVAPSQIVRSDPIPLPDDHPQVRAASASPPPREAYQRASSDPIERAETWQRNRELRRKAAEDARKK